MFSQDRPLFILKIAKEGSDAVPIDLGTRLVSMSYEDNEKKTDKLSLTLDNHDFLFLDSDIFKKGNLLIASWGYAGNMQSSECIVHRISGELTGDMKVEAEHTGFQLHKNRQSRTFENVTRSEVAEKIGKLNGFGSAQMDIEDTKIRHVHITQPTITDAEFLKRLANAEGFEFYVDASGLHFHERKWDQAPLKKLRWFTDSVGEIVSGTYESESKKKKGRVKTSGRDPLTGEPITVDSKNETVPRTSLATVLEHVDSQTGQSNLQLRIADDDVRPSLEASGPAAKRSSDAAYKKQQRSSFKLKLVVVGDPSLHAKSIVEVTGIGKRWSGLWYVEKCVHKLDTHYVTDLECVRDAHNGHKGVTKDAKTAGSVNTQSAEEGPRLVETVGGSTGNTAFEVRWKKP